MMPNQKTAKKVYLPPIKKLKKRESRQKVVKIEKKRRYNLIHPIFKIEYLLSICIRSNVSCDFKYWNFAKGTRADMKSLKDL